MITVMTVVRENGSKIYKRMIAPDLPMDILIKQSKSGLTLIGLPGVTDWLCTDAECSPIHINIEVIENEKNTADNTEDQERAPSGNSRSPE